MDNPHCGERNGIHVMTIEAEKRSASATIRWRPWRTLFATSALVAAGIWALHPGSMLHAPQVRDVMLHDEPAGSTGEHTAGRTANLVLHPSSAADASVNIVVDVAIDDDFIRQVGDGAESQVHEIIRDSNVLLKDIGIQIVVASIQQWESDGAQSYISAHLKEADEQVERTPGRLLLAITCEDDVK